MGAQAAAAITAVRAMTSNADETFIS